MRQFLLNLLVAPLLIVVRVIRSTVEIVRETIRELFTPESAPQPQADTAHAPSDSENSTAAPESVSSATTPASGRPRHAKGPLLRLVVTYLAIGASLKLLGFSWLFLKAAVLEDLIANCRLLREWAKGQADRLYARFPWLRKLRECLAYSMRVETGRALWHRLVEEFIEGVRLLWEILTHWLPTGRPSCI